MSSFIYIYIQESIEKLKNTLRELTKQEEQDASVLNDERQTLRLIQKTMSTVYGDVQQLVSRQKKKR